RLETRAASGGTRAGRQRLGPVSLKLPAQNAARPPAEQKMPRATGEHESFAKFPHFVGESRRIDAGEEAPDSVSERPRNVGVVAVRVKSSLGLAEALCYWVHAQAYFARGCRAGG